MLKLFRLISLIGILSLFEIPALTQVIEENSNNEYIFFEELAERLEDMHEIRIFYDPVIFSDNRFHTSILDYSKEDVLNRISRTLSCTYYILRNDIVVFVPRGIIATGTENLDLGDIITIGNIQEYGKSSVAMVTGQILDGKTGAPLPGAILYNEKYKLGTSSDAKGRFSLEMPVGEYSLTIKYVGFEDRIVKLKVLSSDDVELELFESSVQLEEVQVVSDISSSLKRTQMSILEFDIKDLKELPTVMGEKDVIKSIAFLPGVQTAGEFGTGFNVRGGSNDQNLILLEGAPVFNTSHLFGMISIVNSDMVSGVSLLKAGIPAKYGERASSILNIESGPENPESFKLKGGIGLFNSRMNMEMPLINKKASLIVGGRSSYSNWLLRELPDVELINSSAGFYDTNAKLTINLNQKNKLSFFVYNSEDDFSFNQVKKYNYGNTLASVNWNYVVNEYISSRLVASYSRYNYAITELDTLERSKSNKINADLNYYSIKSDITWSPNKSHIAEFGANAIMYGINPGGISPVGEESEIVNFVTQKEQAREIALYLSDDFKLSDGVRVEAGLRYSMYSFLGPSNEIIYDQTEDLGHANIIGMKEYSKADKIASYSGLEPRLAVRFMLDKQSSLKFSYNRINQYVSLVSNTTVPTPSDLWKLSDQYLKPLKADQFAVGYFNNFFANTVEFSAEVYFKKMNNILDYKNGAQILLNDQLELELINTDGYAYGMEFYLSKKVGRLSGWLSYTYSRSMRYSSSLYESEQINGNDKFPSNFDKPHNFVAIANYHLTKRWRVSGNFSYSTGRPVTLPEIKYLYDQYQLVHYSDRNKYRLPDYHRFDISVTMDESLKIKKRWKGSWILSVINVYGRKNAYSAFYQKDSPGLDTKYSDYSLLKMYIIGRPLPTLTYSVTF